NPEDRRHRPRHSSFAISSLVEQEATEKPGNWLYVARHRFLTKIHWLRCSHKFRSKVCSDRALGLIASQYEPGPAGVARLSPGYTLLPAPSRFGQYLWSFSCIASPKFVRSLRASAETTAPTD